MGKAEKPNIVQVPETFSQGVFNPPFVSVILYAWEGYRYSPEGLRKTISSICEFSGKRSSNKFKALKYPNKEEKSGRTSSLKNVKNS